MGKVILHATLSLDGFIAGPDDEMDWMFKYGSDQMVEDVMRDVGAVVLGKRTFAISLVHNQLPYGGTLKVPQFVVTHEAQAARNLDGLTFTFVTQGVEKAVEKARIAAGSKNVSILGASIDQQCLTAGLADEIVIHVVPILVGEGIRLFDHLSAGPVELERTDAVTTAGITSLRFRVVK